MPHDITRSQWRSQDFIMGVSMAGAVTRAYIGSGAALQPQTQFLFFTVFLGLRSAIQIEFFYYEHFIFINLEI
jgi:hypothetical protein